jgi:hypothetical protein
MDYKDDLKINKNKLDIEWIKQPQLYMQYAEQLAEADRKKQQAKEKLEVQKALTDKEIRENALSKMTEVMVQAGITLDSEYIKVLENYREKCYEYNIVSAAVKAFEQRKSALENLVKLYLSGYFSDCKEPGEINKRMK